jgi:hypothetical protein
MNGSAEPTPPRSAGPFGGQVHQVRHLQETHAAAQVAKGISISAGCTISWPAAVGDLPCRERASVLVEGGHVQSTVGGW